ncbi:MAG: FAD-dependent oxidoreductase [Bacteroidota bacterium]
MKYTLSYWEKEFSQLERDIIILGGGIVGLQTAVELKRQAPALHILLLDKGQGKFGASTKNAGFACFGSPTELLADIDSVGVSACMETVARRWQGLQKLKESVPLSYIDFQPHGGYEVFLSQESQVYQKVRENLSFLNQEIQQATGLEDSFQLADNRLEEMGFQGISHLLFNPYEGQLNPAKLCHALRRKAEEAGVSIWNGIHIADIQAEVGRVTLTDIAGYTYRAKKVVVATNGFTSSLFPAADLHAVRNQVLITDEIQGLPFQGCFHYHEGYVYFRNVGKRVLIGGGRHIDKQGEETSDFGEHPGILAYLTHLLETTILGGTPYTIHHSWSGILGMGKEKMPLLSFVHPNVLLAVRLGGMGVALGWEVGSKAATQVLERL